MAASGYAAMVEMMNQKQDKRFTSGQMKQKRGFEGQMQALQQMSENEQKAFAQMMAVLNNSLAAGTFKSRA